MKIPKTRLNQHHRELLREHASEVLTRVIRHELNADAVDRAMLKLVQRRIKEEFPPKDMAVLARYDKGYRGNKVLISLNGSSTHSTQFELPEPVYIANWCSTIIVEGDDAAAWFGLQAKFKAEFEKRITDYRSLIHKAATFEEVMEAWPLASEIKDKIVAPRTAIVPVDDATLRRIHRDSVVAAKLPPVPATEAA